MDNDDSLIHDKEFSGATDTTDNANDDKQTLGQYLASLSAEDKKLISDLITDVGDPLLMEMDIDDFNRLINERLADLEEQQQHRRTEIITKISNLQAWEVTDEEVRNHPHNYNVGSKSKGGRDNRKAEKQKEKTQIPIFKYSARFRKPLHEAILLNDEPVYLTWSQENRSLSTSKQIEEANRILRPPPSKSILMNPLNLFL